MTLSDDFQQLMSAVKNQCLKDVVDVLYNCSGQQRTVFLSLITATDEDHHTCLYYADEKLKQLQIENQLGNVHNGLQLSASQLIIALLLTNEEETLEIFPAGSTQPPAFILSPFALRAHCITVLTDILIYQNDAGKIINQLLPDAISFQKFLRLRVEQWHWLRITTMSFKKIIEIYPNDELIIFACNKSPYSKAIEKGISCLTKFNKKLIDTIISRTIFDKNKNLVDMVSWFILSTMVHEKIEILKFGKKSHEFISDYLATLRDTNHPFFETWASIAFNQIEQFDRIGRETKDLLLSFFQGNKYNLPSSNKYEAFNALFTAIEKENLGDFVTIAHLYLGQRERFLDLINMPNDKAITLLGYACKKTWKYQIQLSRAEDDLASAYSMDPENISTLSTRTEKCMLMTALMLKDGKGPEFMIDDNRIPSTVDPKIKSDCIELLKNFSNPSLAISALPAAQLQYFFQLRSEQLFWLELLEVSFEEMLGEIKLSTEAIIKACNTHKYHQQVEAKIIRLKKRKSDDIQPEIAAMLSNPQFDFKDMVQWIIFSSLFSESINKAKNNKKPYEIILEYLETRRESEDPIYLKLAKIVTEQIPRFNTMKEEVKHSLLAVFSGTTNKPIISEEELYGEDPEPTKKKKKKKKKKKVEEKPIEAKIEDFGQISLEIPNDEPEETKSYVDSCSEQEEPIYPTLAGERTILDFMLKLNESSEIDDVFSNFYKIAIILSQQVTEGHPCRNKITHFMYNAHQLELETPSLEEDNIVVEAIFISNEKSTKYWNQAIKDLLTKSENYLSGNSNSKKKKSFRKIMRVAISSLVIKLDQIGELWEVYHDLTNFFASKTNGHKIYMIGGLATQCIEEAFFEANPPEVTSDIDLAVVINQSTYSPLLTLEAFFKKTCHYQLLFKQAAPQEKGRYLVSFKIAYKKTNFDVVVYYDQTLSPCFRRVDSYKSMVIDLSFREIKDSYENIMLHIKGLRSFDKACFDNPSSLAYVFRELARMDTKKINLSDESKRDLADFMVDANKKQTIGKAVGLYFTKSVRAVDSCYYQFLCKYELLKYVVPFTEIDQLSKTIENICQSSQKITTLCNNSSDKKNIFPIIYLSLCYIFCLGNENGFPEEYKNHLSSLLFPRAVIKETSSCITHWFELKKGCKPSDSLAFEIYHVVNASQCLEAPTGHTNQLMVSDLRF